MDMRPINGYVSSPPAVNTYKAALPKAVKTAAPVELAAAVHQPAPVPDPEQVLQAVQDINKAMQSLGQGIEFSVDSDSRRTIVKVVDRETGAVVRQMPSKESLEIAKALDKLSGLLIRQKA